MAQSITLKIGSREYPLMAATEDQEQLMRLAAEEINSMLSKYDAKFPDKTIEDKLSFVALQETVSKLSFQRKIARISEEANALKEETSAYLEGKK